MGFTTVQKCNISPVPSDLMEHVVFKLPPHSYLPLAKTCRKLIKVAENCLARMNPIFTKIGKSYRLCLEKDCVNIEYFRRRRDGHEEMTSIFSEDAAMLFLCQLVDFKYICMNNTITSRKYLEMIQNSERSVYDLRITDCHMSTAMLGMKILKPKYTLIYSADGKCDRVLSVLPIYKWIESGGGNVIFPNGKVSEMDFDFSIFPDLEIKEKVEYRRENDITFTVKKRLSGASTNSWLHTSEVLKYFVMPNSTSYDDASQPAFFKNASYGPWKFCWLDPLTPWGCQDVVYLIDEDPSDVSTSVQQSVRRSFFFMVMGCFLNICGLFCSLICALHPNPYASLFISTVIHINAGIANFLCIIVFMSAVSKEVGNKIYPASEMDDPLFHYEYGYSFILIKGSFMLTECAALFSIVVYMAKRDERTFNRYKLRSLLNVHKISETTEDRVEVHASSIHPRFRRSPKGSICSQSPVANMDALASKRNSIFFNPLQTVREDSEKMTPSPEENNKENGIPLPFKQILLTPLDPLNQPETCL